jgi:hypothetical protein
MDFKQIYAKDDFAQFLKSFLPDDFEIDQEELNSDYSFKFIEKVAKLGECKSLDLKVFEIDHKSENDPRVTLSKEAFRLMRSYASRRSLIIFKNPKTKNYRLSLITFQTSWDEGKKIKTEYSNPRRYSFYLGPDAKTRTPEKFLIKLGKTNNFKDLLSRFSVEVVNKDFYREIAKFFNRLTGGDVKITTKVQHFEPEMTLPSVDKNDKKTYQEFAVRLIGRIIFCWFLKQKKSDRDISLMPDEFISTEAVENNESYYHNILEKIFFEVLNRPANQRKPELTNGFSKIPYLNGGLFDPHCDDFYENQPNWALKVPDNWFRDLFEILETYNFTIDENTVMDVDLSIDPEMLGRIFENLLAEINPETGESARKSTGSYYTPRPIVEYMVDQSLIQYLITKTQTNEEKIKALVSLDESDDSKNPLTQSEKETIVEALNEVKIIDPACGSGAFPIGILQKIVWILGRVDGDGKLWFGKKTENIDPLLKEDFKKKFANENFDYIRKTGVIRDSIYGVDIQPIAVEVSKLRCFLTLIVDEDIDDNADNRGIKPLPNLEFKFVAANTLVDLPGSSTNSNGQAGLFEHREDIEELKKLRDQYFISNGYEKVEIRSKFKDIQREMFKKQIAVLGQGQMTMALADWDPFSDKSSEWFDPEWMFGFKHFDISIANPPYFNINSINKEFIKHLSERYKDIHTGYNDIVYYFIFLGIDLLERTGCSIFITSNYFLGNKYATKLRRYLNKHTSKIVNFKDRLVFDAASVHTCISISHKEPKSNEVIFYVASSDKQIDSSNFEKELKPFSIKRCELNDNWVLAEDANMKVIKKINNDCYSLGEITVIKKGATSGNRKVFTVDKTFALHNHFERELLRTSINSKNIKRYLLIDSKKFLIYIDGDTKIKEYPNIFEYLIKNKKELTSRNEVTRGLYPWFRLERPREKEIFDAKEKIVVPYRAENNRFAYDDNQGFNDGGGSYALVVEDAQQISIKFLLGILNSKMMDWYYKFIGKPKGNVREYFNAPLSLIPIKKISRNGQEPFVEIVDKILALTKSDDYLSNPTKQSKVHKYERQIDQMVYKLYSLTAEEINIIEDLSK